MTRLPALAILLVALATGLAACGGGSTSSAEHAPGSRQNPLVGTDPEVASAQLGKANEGTAPRRHAGRQRASHPNSSGEPTGSSASRNGNARPRTTGREPSARQGTTPGTPSSTEAPGYGKLLDRQAKHPKNRFSPCNLVSESQAQSILGAPVQQPLEAPQGPTCIYRTRTGRSFVSLAVQTASYRSLRRLVHRGERITVSGRSGVCGRVGQATLFLPLSGGRVLTIAASCGVAKRFALKAVPQL